MIALFKYPRSHGFSKGKISRRINDTRVTALSQTIIIQEDEQKESHAKITRDRRRLREKSRAVHVRSFVNLVHYFFPPFSTGKIIHFRPSGNLLRQPRSMASPTLELLTGSVRRRDSLFSTLFSSLYTKGQQQLLRRWIINAAVGRRSSDVG